VSKIDADRELQRLRKLYAGKSDGELEKIGRDPATLTEWARAAVRSEMLRRGLQWRQNRTESRPEMPDDDNVLLALRFYADASDAAKDKAALRQTGIEAYYFGENAPGAEGLITWVPSNGVHLLVRAAELAKSLDTLSENQGCNVEQPVAELEKPAVRTEGKPVVLRRYRDITEAMVDRTVLESAGIRCFLYDDNLIRLDWFVSNAIGGAKLAVSENDAAEAAQILEEARPLEE
jgi:hypothetical protein